MQVVLAPASRSLHPAPGSSQKTQGPGEGRGKTARPCLLAALSLPPAVPGSCPLTRAPRRGGLRAPGRVPVVTPARVGPIHSPRRPWTSDREPGPSSVRRVVPGRARGWSRVSAPTHRPPGSASRRGRGPGPEKEGRPTLTARAPSGTGGLPSPLRAGVRVSLPWARLPPLAHTHTCTHTRADTQAHLHTRPAHRTGSQRPGPGRGPQAPALGVRRKDPEASPGRAPGREGPRRQRALPVHLQSRERAEARDLSWDPGASAGDEKSRCPRRRGVVGLTEAGLRPRARGGGGGAGARAPTPPPCLAAGSAVLSARLCPDPLEAEDGSWLLSDLVRQPFCGIKA